MGPTPTLLSDDHQDRLVADKNLVAGRLLDQRPTGRIEDSQQRAGPMRGRLTQATQVGDTGRALGQQDRQETACRRQTDPFGLRTAGEVGLLILVEKHRLGLWLLPLGEGTFGLLETVVEFLQARRGFGPGQFVQRGVGLAIETLPRDLPLLSELGDSAVAAEKDGGGAGQAPESAYDAHGVNLCR
jgi:hypothetical protein